LEYVEVEMKSKGQVYYMKFSKEDLDLVQNKTWHLDNGYAVDNKCKKFHNQLPGLIVYKDGDTIDHINRDRLDNRRNNLRFVSMRIQLINRNKNKNNTSGSTSVSLSQNGDWQY